MLYNTRSWSYRIISFEEKPIKILDWKIKVLKNKEIPWVKILWRHHDIEEATWEPKKKIQERYPKLFTNYNKNFENKMLLRKKDCEDTYYIV